MEWAVSGWAVRGLWVGRTEGGVDSEWGERWVGWTLSRVGSGWGGRWVGGQWVGSEWGA